MDSISLYFKYIAVSVRGQMQYRASFVMLTAGHFLITGIEFLGIRALFDRFGSLKGWTLPEICIFYGMISMSMAISDAASRGFDLFGNVVRRGDFDRLLLRPRSTALQLAGQELTLRRVGRFTQGLIVLLWGASMLQMTWTLPKIMFLATATLGGACLFYGIIVLQATTAFWTVESLEVFNIFTYGGVEAAKYPINVYPGWFRRFFIFIIPLATANYFPAHAILGKPDALGSPVLFQWLSPLVGVAFLTLALQLWKVGVRHYCSTGS